jgi:predicted ATPase
MKRVLLTGMSGTGKSTVIKELAARGYKAVDTDDHGLGALVRRHRADDTGSPLVFFSAFSESPAILQ